MNGFYFLVTKFLVAIPESSGVNMCTRSFCPSLNLYCSHDLLMTTNAKLFHTLFQRQISWVRTYYPTRTGTLLVLPLFFLCLAQHQHSSALLDKDVSSWPQPFRGNTKLWVWSWALPQNAPGTMSLCSCLSTQTDYKWEQSTAWPLGTKLRFYY